MKRYSKTSRTSIKMKSASKRNGRRRYHEDKVAPVGTYQQAKKTTRDKFIII